MAVVLASVLQFMSHLRREQHRLLVAPDDDPMQIPLLGADSAKAFVIPFERSTVAWNGVPGRHPERSLSHRPAALAYLNAAPTVPRTVPHRP